MGREGVLVVVDEEGIAKDVSECRRQLVDAWRAQRRRGRRKADIKRGTSVDLPFFA